MFELPVKERCYSLDIAHDLLVTATAERRLHMFDLKNLRLPIGPGLESPLKHQTRSVACFPDANGFAVSSTEGRVAIQLVLAGLRCLVDD